MSLEAELDSRRSAEHATGTLPHSGSSSRRARRADVQPTARIVEREDGVLEEAVAQIPESLRRVALRSWQEDGRHMLHA